LFVFELGAIGLGNVGKLLPLLLPLERLVPTMTTIRPANDDFYNVSSKENGHTVMAWKHS
jgi:hypothetical protein